MGCSESKGWKGDARLPCRTPPAKPKTTADKLRSAGKTPEAISQEVPIYENGERFHDNFLGGCNYHQLLKRLLKIRHDIRENAQDAFINASQIIAQFIEGKHDFTIHLRLEHGAVKNCSYVAHASILINKGTLLEWECGADSSGLIHPKFQAADDRVFLLHKLKVPPEEIESVGLELSQQENLRRINVLIDLTSLLIKETKANLMNIAWVAAKWNKTKESVRDDDCQRFVQDIVALLELKQGDIRGLPEVLLRCIPLSLEEPLVTLNSKQQLEDFMSAGNYAVLSPQVKTQLYMLNVAMMDEPYDNANLNGARFDWEAFAIEAGLVVPIIRRLS
jgi:hypothetical protein